MGAPEKTPYVFVIGDAGVYVPAVTILTQPFLRIVSFPHADADAYRATPDCLVLGGMSEVAYCVGWERTCAMIRELWPQAHVVWQTPLPAHRDDDHEFAQAWAYDVLPKPEHGSCHSTFHSDPDYRLASIDLVNLLYWLFGITESVAFPSSWLPPRPTHFA
jgi:hypothetical protein